MVSSQHCHRTLATLMNIRSTEDNLQFRIFVSPGIRTYVDAGLMREEARRAANFIEKINLLFDILNSTSPFAKPGKEAITMSNLETKLKDLRGLQERISTWRFQGETLKNNMPFKTGWRVTIDGICRVLLTCLQSGFKFVGTRKLNQDCLEVSISFEFVLGPYLFLGTA